jgi:hypothetical protein
MGESVGVATATRVRERVRPLRVEEIAWLVLLPCALVTVVAIVLLGPPLGRAFFEPTGAAIPGIPARPEPTEHARYAIALLGPALLALATWLVARRRPSLAPALVRPAVHAVQFLSIAFLGLCALTAYGFPATLLGEPRAPIPFVSLRVLAAAALFTLTLAAVLRSPAALARVTRLAQAGRSRGWALACGAVAVAFTANWLLRAVDFDSTIGNVGNLNLIEWETSESWAVLDGRTTLVDYHAVYGHLWPYVGAGALRLFGATLGTWTIAMALVSGLALLSTYAVLRRVMRSDVLALALYLPVVAMAWWATGSASGAPSLVGIFSFWPLRCAGPFLLLWLLARHLDGAAPRRSWLVFVAAWLVLINNAEFGLGALGGTLVAMLLARPRGWARTLGAFAAGGLGAALLVSMLTLTRAGALPDFASILEFPRLFGIEGWGMIPMPTFGLHLMFYGTYLAALALAVVRMLRGGAEPLLTGLLAWAGAFGLLAGSYYVGRSEMGTLLSLRPTWIPAVVLLLVAVVRGIARRPRLPTFAEAAVMFAFGLAIAALPSAPLPWSQVDRLSTPAPVRLFEQPAARAFVAAHTTPGDHVAILTLLGHRLAHDLGLVNVSPFSTLEAVLTPHQFSLVVEEIRRSDAQAVFLRTPESTIGEEPGPVSQMVDALAQDGFSPVEQETELVYLARSSG